LPLAQMLSTNWPEAGGGITPDRPLPPAPAAGGEAGLRRSSRWRHRRIIPHGGHDEAMGIMRSAVLRPSRPFPCSFLHRRGVKRRGTARRQRFGQGNQVGLTHCPRGA
jgi:hypothetical protein